jgi:replicative DNA helicase
VFRKDLKKSRQYRKKISTPCLEFGISYLDDALCGIFRNDLVVIGSSTGFGKTQLATSIAIHNAKQKRLVNFYALEADRYEIHRRIMWQYISQYFYSHRDEFPADLRIGFRGWERGRFDEFLDPIEEKLEEKVFNELFTLEISAPEVSEFTSNTFEVLYNDIAKGSDLVILDHLHYLSWTEQDKNENDALRNSITKLRDLVNKIENPPVILISHLRKKDRINQSLVPHHDELHGSSEISKRANTVVTFAPAFSIPNEDGADFECPTGSTFVRVSKARSAERGTSKYVALINYDLSTNKYDDTYIPFRTDTQATFIKPVTRNKFEDWMKHGKETSE